ncbi:hypothetical protein [Sphingomonas sp. VNH70]|uniref:hypothetical protein n=1 Tax=Sphingomonas silueang TaxID=3156617 RepID=UPI0032B601A9
MAMVGNGNRPPVKETTELFRRLRWLKKASGGNKHDQATVLIEALIGEGIDTRRRIIGAMRRLDFSASHAVQTLAEGLLARRWALDAEGRYRHMLPAGTDHSEAG